MLLQFQYQWTLKIVLAKCDSALVHKEMSFKILVFLM